MATQRRDGWDCKRGAVAHNYVCPKGRPRPTSYTKGLQPAYRKLALALILDPVATYADISAAMRDLPAIDLREAKERLAAWDAEVRQAEPMTPAEWDNRWRVQTGLPPINGKTTPR